MKCILVFLLFFIFNTAKATSENAYTPSDSIAKTDSVKPHSIKTAILWSSFIPGAGQVYNHIAMPKGKKKAYWKVPLIYGGLGTLGYFFIKNQSLQGELKTEYKNRDLGITSDKWSAYDQSGVLTLYSIHSRRRDLFLIGTIAFYLIQIADAGVEAHFVNFDVSENLSLNISPRMYDFNSGGIGLTLNFH